MIHVLGMEPRRSFWRFKADVQFKSQNAKFKNSFLTSVAIFEFCILTFEFLISFVQIIVADQAIASWFYQEEESPDSIEQCTGEEPGPAQAGTESATENYRPPLADKGENVR